MKLSRVTCNMKFKDKETVIREPGHAIEFTKPLFKNANSPSFIFLGMDSKGMVVCNSIVSVKTFQRYRKEVFGNILLNNANSCIVLDNFDNEKQTRKYMTEMRDHLRSLDVNMLDYININTGKNHTTELRESRDLTRRYNVSKNDFNIKSKYVESHTFLAEDGSLECEGETLTHTLNAIYSELRQKDKEHLVALNLDEKLNPINYTYVSIGTINEVPAHPKEFLKPSLLSEAKNVVMLHNHPSGNIKPSRDDDMVTRRISESYSMMGINLMDSIVVGKDEVYSYRATGKLEIITQDPKFRLDKSKFIDQYLERVDVNIGDNIKTGIGDDYIVIAKNENKYLLVNTQKIDNDNEYVVATNIGIDNANNAYFWDYGSYHDNITDATVILDNSYETMQSAIKTYAIQNHKAYIKSVIKNEYSIDNEDALDVIYDSYIDNDAVTLLNPQLEDDLYSYELDNDTKEKVESLEMDKSNDLERE